MSSKTESSSFGDALAPMPGVIDKVMVKEGMEVAQGDPLVIMIAMKMEVHVITLVLGVYSTLNQLFSPLSI